MDRSEEKNGKGDFYYYVVIIYAGGQTADK